MAKAPVESIYQAVERRLKASTEPLTCVELYEHHDIRALVPDVNKVSDVLGNLWRRGYLDRTVAPKIFGSQAKWSYVWKKIPQRRKVPVQAEIEAMQARAYDAQPRPPRVVIEDVGVEPEAHVVLQKPAIRITDNGKEITIELPQLTVKVTLK